MRIVRYLLGLGLLMGGLALAQDAKPKSASVPSGFRAFIAVDNRYPKILEEKPDPMDSKKMKKEYVPDPRDRTKKMHDLVVENGLNPVVVVLTRTPTKQQDSQVAKLVKQLDPLVTKHRASNLAAFVVFATLDKEFPMDEIRVGKDYVRDQQEQELINLATGLKVTKVPFALAARNSENLTKWGLADNAETQVVLYHRLQILQKWPAEGGTLSDQDITAIVAATDKEAAAR